MAIPEDRLKFYRRVRLLKQTLEEDSVSASASRLIIAVTVAWQELSYPNLRIETRRPYGTLNYARRQEVSDFAKWLAALNDFNVAAYWLATAYAILVGVSARNKSSLYFTPPALAHRVIDSLVLSGASLTAHTWHDPACGGAAFLVPVAQRMASELARSGKTPAEILTHVQSHISGTDLEPNLLELSKQFLRMALYDLIGREGLPEFDLQLGDGLSANPKRCPNVVICNPPYRKISAFESPAYMHKFSETIQGQPNVYGLFIQRSIELVKAGGLAGLLTPTSFLSGQYFSKLRTWILRNSRPLRLEMLSGRKSTFIDVEQETAIMIVDCPRDLTTAEAEVNLTVRADGGLFEEIGTCMLPACGKPWPIAKRVEDVALVLAASKSSARLGSYGFRAKIGHLVDYRDKRIRLSRRSEGAVKSLTFPLVWATDVSPDGIFKHGRNRRSHRNELFVQQDRAGQGGVIKKPVLLMQRVTSTDQPRRLVCAVVPPEWLQAHGGIVAENHVVVVEAIDGVESAVSPQLLASILRSESVDRLFRSISGAANVSIFELNEMPLPDPAIVKRELLVRRDIEKAVLKGYGMLDFLGKTA